MPATQSDGELFPTAITHPGAGPCALDLTRIAVRWRPGAGKDPRAALLSEAGLVPVDSRSDRPSLSVNRTDGLWWARSADDAPIPAETLERLEQSDIVEWATPAYRRAGEPADEGARFAVNPTRLYLREDAVEALDAASALPSELSVDTHRTSRIPGLVALRIDRPSAAEQRTAVHVAQAITATLLTELKVDTAPGLRFESIPYYSPTCHANGACPPPTSELIPNDPFFQAQWGLQRIGSPRAWQIARGDASITVAVIDEGVELAHADLDLHPQSWNASTDTPDGGPTGNHGTACAGIVAARLDNGQGVAGVAGGARIMAIATATWADIDVAEGLYFAADNGAHVVSMSFGVYPSWNAWDFDVVRDALQYARDRGLVLVAASGNEDIAESRFPGSDERTICVGGSNRDDERKRNGDASSEPGWGACYGPSLSVVAPCLDIPTTDRLGADGYTPGDYADHFNGTSAATPHVAGLAALMLSLRPSLSAAQVGVIIETTADKISPSLYAYAHVASKPNGTWQDEVGYGRINAERALLAACAAEPGDEDGCSGCGGRCADETPAECRAPAPIPWLPFDRCMSFYEGRVFDVDADQRRERRHVQVRVTYEHRLCMVGRQQGPLLYTTTLLPGETVQLFEFDRYRRVRSATERVSVHSSFRQTLSALSQTRRLASSQSYMNTLNEVRAQSDTSASAGGGLAGFFGAPSVSSELSLEAETSIASGAAVQTASEQFTQIAVTSAQSTEAERSIVVSSFEEAEHQATTRRSLHNANECYAVTYYVRSVNEVYEASTRVVSLEWRVDGGGTWRSIDDLDGVAGDIRKTIVRLVEQLPQRDAEARNRRPITLPTDGTLYEAELSHCSSCEPSREEAIRIELEIARVNARRACLEGELLELELERRRGLAGHAAIALDVGSWPLQLGGREPHALPAHTVSD